MLFFFLTRCKQTRFCNKQCEKEAHTKEKSTKKEPENYGEETEDLLKKEVEAEMKRNEKIKRREIKTAIGVGHTFAKMLSGAYKPGTYDKDTLLKFEGLTKWSS